MLLEKIKKTIKENRLLKKGQKAVVACSGGPDSTCLLHLLWRLKKDLKLKLFVVHLNHGIRGKEALQDEAFVRKLAQRFDLPFISKRIDLSKIKTGLEARARQERYKFFEEVRRQKRADIICLAHTASDQVETIIMNFLRGAGLKGLLGMIYRRDKVVRPLLNCFRQEIQEYLKQNKLKFRQDVMNEDISYLRSRIRHQLIPLLKKYNPNLKETLLRNAKILSEDYEFISGWAKEIAQLSTTWKDKKTLEINLQVWHSLPLNLQRHILRKIYEEFFGYLQDIEQSHIEEILKMIKQSRTGSLKELRGLRIFKNYDKIIITKILRRVQLKPSKPLILNIPGQTNLPKLKLQVITSFCKRIGRSTKNQIYLDLARVKKLYLRTRKKGDRFYPQGMLGSKKLTDFFIDAKISRPQRDKIALMTNFKDEIVWVLGFRQDRRFLATPKSKRILKVIILK